MSDYRSRKKSGYIVVAALMGIIWSSVVHGLSHQTHADKVHTWEEVLSAYDAYVANPTSDNAQILLKALPEEWPSRIIGNSRRAWEHIQSMDYFPVLYEEFISGQRTAVEIFFRLLNVADGIYMQILLTNLGWLARDKPQIFLDVLLAYQDASQVKTFGYAASFIGMGHNIHPRAALHVLEKRMEALRTVEDPKYNGIKGKCLKAIHEAMEAHKKFENQ